MSSFFKSIKSVAVVSIFGVALIGCQSISTTGTSTYSPQAKQSDQQSAKSRWDARVASIREKQQARILKMREFRAEFAEKRKTAMQERKVLAEKRRQEVQERLALRMASNKTVKKAKLKSNQAKINRAFGKAKDDSNKSLRTGWVKIDGKFVYRSAKTIKAEQEVAKKAAKRKVRRKSNPKGSYGKLIAKYAAQHGVPYRLARAVVQVESSFRAGADFYSYIPHCFRFRLSDLRRA